MATKQMLSARLDTAVIAELQRLAAERRIDVSGLISQALDALNRKDEDVAVAAQMKNFEAVLVRLIGMISSLGVLLTETEDRAFRAWQNSRLSLEWCHLIVKSGGMPSVEQWKEKFTKSLADIEAERNSIKEARQKKRDNE